MREASECVPWTLESQRSLSVVLGEDPVQDPAEGRTVSQIGSRTGGTAGSKAGILTGSQIAKSQQTKLVVKQQQAKQTGDE